MPPPAFGRGALPETVPESAFREAPATFADFLGTMLRSVTSFFLRLLLAVPLLFGFGRPADPALTLLARLVAGFRPSFLFAFSFRPLPVARIRTHGNGCRVTMSTGPKPASA